MSEKNSVCIICNEGSTSSKRLTNNPDMIDKLVDCCNERLSLGQSDIKQLSDRIASLSESERKYLCYQNIGNPLSTWAWLNGSGVSESGKIHLNVLCELPGHYYEILAWRCAELTANMSYDSTFREQKHLQHPLILTHKFSRGRPESWALSQSGFHLSRQRKHGEEILQFHSDRSYMMRIHTPWLLG